MDNLEGGLRIVGVGIVGVFVNLLVLMAVVHLLGLIFGKKKKKKKDKGPKADKVGLPPAEGDTATPVVETTPASEPA